MLIDLRTVQSFSLEARRASSGPHISPYLSAVAVPQNNPVATVIYNWVLYLQRPAFATRLFTDEHRALEWLAKFAPIEQSGGCLPSS